MSLSEHVYARYLSGYSPTEISESMGITYNRVVFQILAVGMVFEVAFKNGW